MEWDKDLANTIRAMAITDINDIKIGGIYYSNYANSKIMVKDVITYREMLLREGRSIEMVSPTRLTNKWLVVVNLDYYDSEGLSRAMGAMEDWEMEKGEYFVSAHDNNIGASYNPWFIFDSKEALVRCVKELNPTFKVAGVAVSELWPDLDAL